MKFQLKEIQPNPFRRIEKYPIRKDKVEELKESINAVGFWEGVPVRINEKDKPELVFGHHRLAALKDLYSGTQEFNWNVVKYSDAQMIQAMARENATTYSTSVSIIMESIKSAIEAYTQGKVKPEEISMATGQGKRSDIILYAPHFAEVSGAPATSPYTEDSLAKFLGMSAPNGEPQEKFKAAFGALELIEQGYLKESQITDEIGTKYLFGLVQQLKKQRDEAERDKKHKEELARIAAHQAEEAKKRAEAAEQQRDAEEQKRKADRAKREAEQKQREAVEATRKAEESKRRIKEAGKRVVEEIKEDRKRTERGEVPRITSYKNVASKLDEETAKVARHAGKPKSQDDEEDLSEEEIKFLQDFTKKVADARRAQGTSQIRSLRVPEAVVRFAKEIVKEGRRTLAMKYHPDKSGGSNEDMAGVNAAEQWLTAIIIKEAA